MILVSACLMGVPCRYDGRHNLSAAIKTMAEKQDFLPVCPEQLGGLLCPRPPAEIVGGTGIDVIEGRAKVINIKGEDVTPFFIKGAQIVLNYARKYNIKTAITKARSPSCGSGCIYDGSFCKKVRHGDGVTAAILKMDGIKVLSEEEYNKG